MWQLSTAFIGLTFLLYLPAIFEGITIKSLSLHHWPLGYHLRFSDIWHNNMICVLSDGLMNHFYFQFLTENICIFGWSHFDPEEILTPGIFDPRNHDNSFIHS